MNTPARLRRARLAHGALVTLALSACGGGGGGGGGGNAGNTAPTPLTTASQWPSSGRYAVALRAGGTTTAGQATVALSLVHPSTPTVEYVMDTALAPSPLGLTLYEGNYDAASAQFKALAPVAYVDAPNGQARTTMLAATGARPLQSSGPAKTICPGSTLVASDFAQPFASQIVAPAPGSDGTCGTADDDQFVVTFSAGGVPQVDETPLRHLGFLRSAATGAPSAWLYTADDGTEGVEPIGTGGAVIMVAVGQPGAHVAFAPVADLSDTILFTRDGALVAVGNAGGPARRQLASALTGPDGWKPAGNDATYAYAYVNSNTANSGQGTWQLLAIARSDLSVTTLATGAGTILQASAGAGTVFVTQLYPNGTSRVTAVAAPSGTQSTVAWSSISSTRLGLVITNPSGLNTAADLAMDLSDHAAAVTGADGAFLWESDPGLMYGADGDAVDAASGSVMFTGVYVVADSATTAMGGASLTRWDGLAQKAQAMGRLPTGADLGGTAGERVFVTPLSSDGTFGGFYACRMSGTQLVTTGSAVYTFVPGAAGAVRTTSQVK